MKQKKPDSSLPIAETEPNRFKDLLDELETAPDKLKKRFPTLSTPEQLGLLLLTTGMTRQSLLLSSPYAKQLVPMFPEQEIYITIKEIGLADATGLLALMGPEQLMYYNDLEAWEKNLFHGADFLELLKSISQCGEDKFALLLETIDPEILTLVLKENGFVSKLDIYQDPVEESDTAPFFTYDGYYRYHPKEAKLRPLLEAFVRVLQARFPEKYGMVMESAYQDHYSEVEEEALRFRSNRLAEKGLPDFEAASEIYYPLSEAQFKSMTAKSDLGEETAQKTASLYPIRWLRPDSLVHKALKTLADHPETDRIRMELATIGNKVLIADGQEVKDLESLKEALQKVSGFLSIALESLSDNDIRQSASWLTQTWAHFLFRFGYGKVIELVKKAQSIQGHARFRWIDKYHYLADKPLEETLLGLLRPRPLFFEPEKADNLEEFRQFQTMNDIRLTENRLAAIKGFSTLFTNTLSLSPERIKTLCQEGGLADRLDSIKWCQILQTFWAWKILTGNPTFQILSPADVQHFIRIVFPAAGGDSNATGFDRYTRTLTDWLCDHLPEVDRDPKELIIDTVISEAERMKEELSGLNPDQPVDGRLIQCLCVKE